MTGIIGDLEVNKEVIKQAADFGYAIATDLADWLVRRLGLLFREARHITGRIVALVEKKKCHLNDLSLVKLQMIYPDINAAVFEF